MGPATVVAVLQFSVVTSNRFVFILLFISCCMSLVRQFIRVLLSILSDHGACRISGVFIRVRCTSKTRARAMSLVRMFIRVSPSFPSDRRVPCHRCVCSSVRSVPSRVITACRITACRVTGASVHPCVLSIPSDHRVRVTGAYVHLYLAVLSE